MTSNQPMGVIVQAYSKRGRIRRYNEGTEAAEGFTLIELIITIAVIAALATTVILVINPVNLFKEARDSQRIADVEQMNRAASFYAANVGDIPTAICNGMCHVGLPTDLLNNHNMVGLGSAQKCGNRYNNGNNGTTVTSTVQSVNANGWPGIDLTAISLGAPLSAWPLDPKTVITLNGSNLIIFASSFYYSFACYADPVTASTGWEFSTNLESVRYASSNAETDGGTDLRLYEVGTNVGL